MDSNFLERPFKRFRAASALRLYSGSILGLGLGLGIGVGGRGILKLCMTNVNAI